MVDGVIVMDVSLKKKRLKRLKTRWENKLRKLGYSVRDSDKPLFLIVEEKYEFSYQNNWFRILGDTKTSGQGAGLFLHTLSGKPIELYYDWEDDDD